MGEAGNCFSFFLLWVVAFRACLPSLLRGRESLCALGVSRGSLVGRCSAVAVSRKLRALGVAGDKINMNGTTPKLYRLTIPGGGAVFVTLPLYAAHQR